MATNLSIDRVPDELMARLRDQAERHGRTVREEVIAILEQTVLTEQSSGHLTIEEAEAELERIGLRTPSEAVQMIREDRDAR